MSEQIEAEGFVVKTVKPGDTLWEYSEQVFGTGYKWREILRENPFLNQPGRVEQDATGRWIVILYKGESIIVRGGIIYPSSTSSSSSATTVVSSHHEKRTSVVWWMWVLIGLGGAALAVGYFAFLGHAGTSGRSLTKDASIAKYQADRKVWEMNNETIRLFITSLRDKPASYDCRIERDGALQVKGGDVCLNRQE